jgi:hypothetical protein
MIGCAGNPSSCAGNRTHSTGLTRVYIKIEKSRPRVCDSNCDFFEIVSIGLVTRCK